MQRFYPGHTRSARKQTHRRARLRRLTLLTGLLSMSVSMAVPAVQADTIVWTGLGGDNLWSTQANWFDMTTSATALPTSADYVNIGSAYTANVSADNASTGWLNNSGAVSVTNLYTLNVAQDLFNNNGGTLQVSGALQAPGPGTPFSTSASYPGSYDVTTTGTTYTTLTSSVNLLGGGNQLQNAGTLQAQSGGFLGSQYSYDANGNLVGATGTYSQVTNSNLIQADGGIVYHSQDSVSTFTNVNASLYGIIGEVANDSYNNWQSSAIQLYGGTGSLLTNQAGAALLSTNGAFIRIAAYDTLNNAGGVIQADGESALFASDTGSYTVTNPDGTTSGPFAYQYNSIASSEILIQHNGAGTLNNINGGTIEATNGGLIYVNGYNNLTNDATSSIAAIGSGPNSGFSSTVSISLTGNLNNAGLIYGAAGGSVSAYGNTAANLANGTVWGDGLSASYTQDSNGTIALPSSYAGMSANLDVNNDGLVLATNGGEAELFSYNGNVNLSSTSVVQADGWSAYTNIYSGNFHLQPSQVFLDTVYGGTIVNQGSIQATNGGSVQVLGDYYLANFTNLGAIQASGGVYYYSPDLQLYSSEFATNDVDQFNNGGQIGISSAATATLNANDLYNWKGAGIVVTGDPTLLGQFPASEADINAVHTINNAGTIAALQGGLINLTALETFTNGDRSGNGALIADGAPTGTDGNLYPSAISVLAPNVVNQGLMQASNGGQISVTHETFTNTGNGRIDAQTGSVISVMAMLGDPALVQNSAGASIHVDGTLNLWNQATNAPGELVLDGTDGAPGLGGRLSGSGVINGNVTNVDGVVHPGNSPGILTINGNYTQEPQGRLEIAIDKFGGIPGVDNSLLDVTGTLTIEGAFWTSLDLSNLDWSTFQLGSTIDFIEFGSLNWSGPFNDFEYSVLVDPNNPNMIELRSNVPEPGPYLLLASGALSLLALRRRAVRSAR